MSNDDSTPPDAPRDDSETGLGRLGHDPTDGDDSAGGIGDETSVFAPPSLDEPTPPGGGVPVDATQVMPITPSLPAENPTVMGGAVPPGAPMGPNTTTIPLEDEPSKWYQQPGLVAGALVGLLAIGALVVFLFLVNGDGDGVVVDGESELVSLSITRNDANGGPLATTIAAEVATNSSNPFVWVTPAGVAEGEPARVQTVEGRAEFRWSPASQGVEDVESSVVLREFVAGTPDGEFVASVAGQCTVDRDGEIAPVAVDTVLVADTTNDSTTQAGEYTFPNTLFRAGDRIECTLSDVGPGDPAPTTVPPESSTVPETTIVPDTTPPETAPPETAPPETAPPETAPPETAPPETAPPETTTTTTTTTTTLPPEPPAESLGDVLRRDPELSQTLSLLTRVGLLDELEEATQPFTLFVPNNDAIDELRDSDDAPDLDDDDVVRSILEAHLSAGQAFSSEQIATVTEIPVEIGRPQPVDGSEQPPTIGGVSIIGLDLEVDGGLVHVLDGVIQRL